MSATVEIQTETAKDVLTVPIQAVTTRVEKDSLDKINGKNKDKDKEEDDHVEKIAAAKKTGEVQECVFVFDKDIAKKSDVKTGIQDNSFIEIVSDLKAGDEVITAPFSAISKKLSDSTLVQVVKKEELFKVK